MAVALVRRAGLGMVRCGRRWERVGSLEERVRSVGNERERERTESKGLVCERRKKGGKI